MYKHPLVATLLLSFLSLTALATDRYVDPSIWPATLPNYYMTVTEALNAAQSGDRIFIAPGAYATPAITLSQDIEIYSMDTTDVVQLYNGNMSNGTPITINGTANMQVKMSGFSCGDITINGAADMQVQVWKLTTGFWSITGASNLVIQMDSVTTASSLTISANGYSNNSIKLSTSQFGTFNLTASENFILDATKVNFGAMNVSGYLGSRFTFANCRAISLSSTSCSATANSRAKINVIDCVFLSNLNIDHDNFLLNCIQTRIVGNTLFRYGNFITSRTTNLTVANEYGLVDTVNKILVAADTVDEIFNYSNDKLRFVIANNLLNRLQIARWLGNNTITNKIINNEFIGNYQFINIPRNNVPYYNFDVSNNILPSSLFIIGGTFCYIWGNPSCGVSGGGGCNPPYPPYSGSSPNDFRNYSILYDGSQSQTYYCYFYTTCWGWQNYWYYFAPASSSSVNDCAFPNRDVPGFFKWTYNGFALPGTGSLPGNLTFINTPGTSNTVNAGNPAPEYTDIDLTRNDRGRLGGPYSILNYNPANPNNSKAFIFDLDIPTQFSPASPSINIQAKGYHRN
jgi:hypothetical protein